MVSLIVWSAVGFLGFWIASSIRVVNEGNLATISTFGRFLHKEPKKPGLHIVLLGVQKMSTVDSTIRTLDMDPFTIVSGSGAGNDILDKEMTLRVNMDTKFQILNPVKMFRNVGDETSLRSNLVMTQASTLNNVISTQSPRVSFTGRTAIERAVANQLNSLINGGGEDWGVRIISTNLVTLEPEMESTKTALNSIPEARMKKTAQVTQAEADLETKKKLVEGNEFEIHRIAAAHNIQQNSAEYFAYLEYVKALKEGNAVYVPAEVAQFAGLGALIQRLGGP